MDCRSHYRPDTLRFHTAERRVRAFHRFGIAWAMDRWHRQRVLIQRWGVVAFFERRVETHRHIFRPKGTYV